MLEYLASKKQTPARGLAGGGAAQSVVAVLSEGQRSALRQVATYATVWRSASPLMCDPRFYQAPVKAWRRPRGHLPSNRIPTAWDTCHGVPR